MPVSIVVGGQYGSEGKGKVALYFAHEMNATFAVRCGGPNSGHTVIDKHGRTCIFQQLPTAAILPDVKLAICSGSYIDVSILFKEIKETNVGPERLIIDPNAVIITEELKAYEKQSGLIARIGSTGSGTGAAVAARINREASLLFAKDIPELKLFISDVPEVLRAVLNQNERIIIEGTQGFGLSPFHAGNYPFTTSRDTTAAAFLAEAGLGPLDVDDVIMAIRAFPIRVEGNSGPLPKEINWEILTEEGKHKYHIEEKTSVTKRLRRVARFSPAVVKKAIEINNPTKIVLNHLDYVNKANRNIFVKYIEKSIGIKSLDYIGLGPNNIIKRNHLTLIKSYQTQNQISSLL